MLTNFYDEETDTRIIYVYRCACRQTGLSWYLIQLLNKNLITISAQIVSASRFTVLLDAQVILIARQMLYGQNP